MTEQEKDTEHRKKRAKRKRAAVCLAAAALLAAAAAGLLRWRAGEPARFVRRLGCGINLGNALDATNLRDYRPDAGDLEYETFWGNPPISQTQLAAVREAGFRTVRIPVSWEDHMAQDGMVSAVWMDRVQEVVDLALAEDLYVILDTHHEGWLDLQTGSEAERTGRLRTLWGQIAARFADYDERLLFEGMNEPRLVGSAHEWDEGTQEAREEVGRLNAAFVETVRESGGRNRSRYLLLCPYASNTLPGALETLQRQLTQQLPQLSGDRHLLVSVHAYLPYAFCQDEAGTAEWDGTRESDTAEIRDTFARLGQFSGESHVPVVLTEFGCIDKQNDEARLAWTQYMRQTAQQYGIPCIWWDNGSGFALLDRETGGWRFPRLTRALTDG